MLKRIKLDTDNIKDSDHLKFAFVGACEAGDEKIVKLLLPWVQENDVNCADSLGVTGLMAALEKDQYEVGGLLLDLPGLDISVRDRKGRTVLTYLLVSNSLFYFEEIVEGLKSILPAAEINDRLLAKLTKCVATTNMKDIALFKRLLAYYDINYKNGELLNRVMRFAGDNTVLAVIAIIEAERDGPFELTRYNLISVATAAAAGHPELIRLMLPWHGVKDMDMDLFISLCREKGVNEENINQELTETLCTMMVVNNMYKSSKTTFELLERALMLLDINYQDQKGETILMKVLQMIGKCGYEGLRIVENLLKMEKLDLNLVNKNGKNALDFLSFHNYREPDKDKDRVKDFLHLSPVVNRISSKKGIPENILSCFLSLDVQLLNQFKVRRDTFKDVDFNYVQHSLLSQAMKVHRLDLVRFLIIDCNVKVLQCDLEVWRWLGSLKIEDMKWCEVKEILGAVFEKIVKEEQRNTMAETDKITVLNSETLDTEDTSHIAHGQARRRVRVKKKHIQRLCLWALSKLFF